MACPDANEIVAFAAGTTPAEDLARVREHIDGCADCAELVAEAVEAEPGTSADELDPAPTTPVGAVSTDTQVESAPVTRGATLGRYIVLARLAAGGLGVVYVAYDPKLDRKVALKVLRQSVAGAGEQKWLLREAQAMAKLSHPNVVPVHDVGMFESSVFVAMELIEGRTFTQWVHETERGWQEVRDLLIDAAQGLMAAHAAGLIHRDFKPSNILVGHDGRVRVVDFGLARTVTEAADGAQEPRGPSPATSLLGQSLTSTGSVVGTPAFMSPEQHRGGDIGFEADQFAFCVTLFYGLYGIRPFEGESFEEIREAIMAGTIQKPPSDRSVPTWLHKAVLRGMSYAAEDRFPSMDALLVALTRDHRKRQIQWFAVALSLVVSTAGASLATVALQPEPTASDTENIEAIVAQARAAAGEAYFVYPPSDDPDLPTAYESIVALESIEGPAADLGKEAAADLRIEFAEALRVLGDRYWDQEGGDAFAADYYGAAQLFQPEDDLSRARMQLTPVQFAAFERKAQTGAFSASELEAGDTLATLAEPDPKRRRQSLERLQSTASLPSSVRAQLDALAGPKNDAPDVVAAGDGEPDVVVEDSGREEPKPRPAATASEPKPAAPVHPPARDENAAATEVALGQRALAAANWKEAIRHFHAALDHDARSHAAVGGLAEAHFESGEFTTSVRYGKRAIAMAPKRALYRITLGDAYRRLLRYADARREYEKAGELGSKAAASRLRKLDAKTR